MARAAAPDKTWHYLPHLLAAGLMLRVAFALATSNAHCPDEMFQYLEQAHRVVYGYGVIPWDYRFGVRSWALPGFVAGLLALPRMVGLDQPAGYIPAIKIVFSLISLSLIASIYYSVRVLISENIARLAAVLATIWYELVYLAHKPSVDALSVYAWFAALAVLVGRPTLIRQIAFGALTAFAVGIRIQNGPIVLVLLVFALTRWPWRRSLPAVAAFMLVCAGFGALDLVTWGDWFGSYIRYFHFNWTVGADNFFGRADVLYYMKPLVLCSVGLALVGLRYLFYHARHAWVLIAAPLVTLVVYSVPAHKEVRFIFAVIPFWLIGFAIFGERLSAARLNTFWAGTRTLTPVRAGLTGLVAAVSLAGAFGFLPLEKQVYPQAPSSRAAPLEAYRLLSRAAGVRGIIDEATPWWRGGGYFMLHKDVPIYYPEFFPAASFPGANPEPYVSHWMRPAGAGSPGRGYELWRTVGRIAIWRRQSDPRTPEILGGYTRNTIGPLDALLTAQGMRHW